jgi:prepilin peptidase CpaA
MVDPLIISKSVIHDSALFLAVVALVMAALSDIKKLTISNRLCLVLAALFPIYVLTSPHDIMWVQHLLIAGVVLAIGFGLFAMNVLGGGDVKLLAAASLWAGPHMIGMLLFFTAFAGGLLALVLAAIALYRVRMLNLVAVSETNEVIPWYKISVPYGVAIACGGVVALLMA